MNKKLLAATVAAVITLTTGVAMANPVELDGSTSLRYRSDNTNGNKNNTSIFRFTLNAKTEIATNLSVYARFSAEGLSNGRIPAARDYSGTNNSRADLDNYGLLYSNAGFTYKIGQQSPVIGGLGLLYDASGYLGDKDMGVVRGVNIKGKSGVTSLDFLAAQENNAGDDDGKIYAIRASYNPSKALTLGATLAQYKKQIAVGNNGNFWATDVSYAAGKATYSAEYAKSNFSTDNQAYALGVSYAADAKNTLWVYNYKVEQHADINAMTTFDSGDKGFYYGVDHKFNKDTALHLFYRDKSNIKSGSNNTSFRATVSYNF